MADRDPVLIGFEATGDYHRGLAYGHDRYGRFVGTYDPRRDPPRGETFDRNGRFIGNSDPLSSLITII